MEKYRLHPVDRALPPSDATIEDSDHVPLRDMLSPQEMLVSFPKNGSEVKTPKK